MRSAIITWSVPMVHADSWSGAASFHHHKHLYIYRSRANTVAGNLFILRFLVLPHLHRDRDSWNLLRVRALLDRSWKWRGRDFRAFLDAVNREIYLEHLIALIKISIFGARYRFSYRMEKDRHISPYRFIVPPLVITESSSLWHTCVRAFYSCVRATRRKL